MDNREKGPCKGCGCYSWGCTAYEWEDDGSPLDRLGMYIVTWQCYQKREVDMSDKRSRN